MPADLPSLDRLTADVAAAMRAAEEEEAGRAGAAPSGRRRRRWWGRTPPLAAVLAALVLAASALALLHATSGQGAERTLPGARCDAAQAVTITVALAAGTTVAAGVRCTRCAVPTPAAAPAALSRRDGRPAPMPSPRPCA